MEINLIASKWVPAKPDESGRVKQEVIVRFMGNRDSMEELLELMKEAGYEIT